jgi:enoyl-CoA hydratase/carnithine racemase
MNDKILIREKEEEVAILRLNRPEKANGLNRNLFVALRTELDLIAWDDDVKLVIITGEGEKAFCAGIDLKEKAKKAEREVLIERAKVIRPFYLTLGDFPKPIIDALNRPAYGGGRRDLEESDHCRQTGQEGP